MAVDTESALYKQALAEEAVVLGIMLPQERYLLPIAEEALLAEPPPPWKVGFLLFSCSADSILTNFQLAHETQRPLHFTFFTLIL